MTKTADGNESEAQAAGLDPDQAVTTPIPGMDSETGLHIDSVAAIIHVNAGRYLLQHREEKPSISYPGAWGLFGGSRERGELSEDALRRELREELELSPKRAIVPFLFCTYEIFFEGRRARKNFFDVQIDDAEAERLVLHEGQGKSWFSIEEVLALYPAIVHYDLGLIALHHHRHYGDR